MKILHITAQGLLIIQKDLDINFLYAATCLRRGESLCLFWTGWKWGVRRNITADSIESWWIS